MGRRQDAPADLIRRVRQDLCATQETLLRAALMTGAEALDAWNAIRPHLLGAAELDRASRRVLPLLGANLRRLGLDEPLAVQCDAIRHETAAKTRVRFDGGRRFLTA